MEESRGIASSPATGMAEESEEITQEAGKDLSEEWFFYMLDGQQPDREARSKHRIPVAPAKFREYEKDKKYFDPRVVSLGPYHNGEDHLMPMEKYKITAAKEFVDEFIHQTGGRGGIYQKFNDLTRELKECYDDQPDFHGDFVFRGHVYYPDDFVLRGHVYYPDDLARFVRMMFLDGCFVLHFIEKIDEGAETILEISNDVIPLIIRDMFLMENQLPFQVLDALMNLRRGSSNLGTISLGKESIVEFIVWKVLKPMGFYSLNSHRLLKWFREPEVVDGVEQYDRPLHLLDILRTILLDCPTKAEMRSYINIRPNFDSPREIFEIIFGDRQQRNFSSITELKEIGIRFKKRRMESLMEISYKEHLLFPQLLLPAMFINDTTISQLLNLTALEACSNTYSGCGVSSFIHFMDSLINDGADVKKLRSKGILHRSLGSDDEVARLFNTWPADVTNDLKLYSDISMQILRHRKRTVKISIATWLDKYFGSPWTAISFVAAVVLLVFTAIQTYFTAFPRG